MHPTKNPRVNLSRTARWLHANLDRPGKRPKLYLHAWDLEDERGDAGSDDAYVGLLIPVPEAELIGTVRYDQP